ncbi:MAG: NAD(P)-dependent oxidoreductase [Candidatus Cloacimonetes bacterium]|nr:NAD(P)-dependent oxidoreductase [Candidatus Cloacimonadota bacterium]
MNIFITGSTGFVGSRLIWFLEEKGHTVWGIDRDESCLIEKHPNNRRGDIRNTEDYEQFDSIDFDLVIHCAAEKHDFGISQESYFSTNEYGTKVLTDFMTRKSIPKIIYYSTVSIYGHQDHPCDESADHLPNTIYGEAKLAGEIVIEEWWKEDVSREVIFLRPTIIYGPYNYANMYNLVDTLYRKPYFTIGECNHIKSIVSLANLVDMTYFIMSHFKPGIQAYNCIDKPYITLHKLMEIIASHKGFHMPYIRIPLGLAVGIGKIFDVIGKIVHKDLPINSDRMKKFATSTDYRAEKIRELGYKQCYTIEEEITRTIEWYYKERGIQVR